MITMYKKERFRLVRPQSFYNFPANVDPLQLEIIGNLQGERINIKAPLTLSLFDSISYVNTSYNHTDLKCKKPIYHVIGYRQRDNSLTIIAMR